MHTHFFFLFVCFHASHRPTHGAQSQTAHTRILAVTFVPRLLCVARHTHTLHSLMSAPPPKLTRLIDLRPSLQPVNVQFIVLEKGERVEGEEAP